MTFEHRISRNYAAMIWLIPAVRKKGGIKGPATAQGHPAAVNRQSRWSLLLTVNYFASSSFTVDASGSHRLGVMKASIFALALVLGISSAYAITICPKYVVQSGDSLYSISQKFDVLPDELNAAISACGQSATLLQVGQEICLPGSEKPGCSNVKAYNSNENCKVYVVQQGDTINSVAESLGIYNQELQNLNADVVANGILQPNKYLKLPTWSQTCGDPNKAGDSCRVYIVKSGDFVAGIAAAFGVSLDDLLAVNPGLSAGAVLQNGQPIKIPPFPASCGAGTPTEPPTDTVIKCRGYRVQTGDNLQSIAQAFRTTVAELGNVNPELAGGALVQPGTIVKIPPYDSSCDQPLLVPLPSADTSPVPPSSSPVPVPIPSPIPLVSPSPVVLAPLAALSPSPVLAPVPAPAPIAAAPVPAVSVPTVSAPAPAPVSSAINAKAALAAVFAVVFALAL